MMKRTLWMALTLLLLWGVGSTAAQSLGDYARTARKNKARQNPSTRQYDNDNLPKQDHLSVVGPAPADAATAQTQQAGQETSTSAATPAADAAPAKDPKEAVADRKQAADEWQKKIDEMKQRVDTLNRDLDLTQREYRLRAAAMYGDAGSRLRNASTWDKEDADFKQQIADKQKAVDAARQELESLEEGARKAGAAPKNNE